MLIKMKPLCVERVWGGRNLERFGYELSSNKIGEAWCISGHEAGSSFIDSGIFAGMTLRELYANRRDLFAFDSHDEFPLLVKLLDAHEDLSIQIHPGDDYAQKYEQSPYGKTECWFVLDAEPGSRLVLGHQGKVMDVKKAILDDKLEEVIRYEDIHKGDFFFVPAGTVHAICRNTIIYEVQQSSDITYRLYDYNRLENGVSRELHIEQAVNVLEEFEAERVDTRRLIEKDENYTYEILIDCPYFVVEQYVLKNKVKQLYIENKTYLLCSVLEGKCIVNGEEFVSGDHFICSSQIDRLEIFGAGQFFVTRAKI